MLTPFQQIQENPEDVPVLTERQRQGLQARFNAGWHFETGTVAKLKSVGYSEEFILGYLAGLTKASSLLDDFESIRENLKEEE
ncbi:MAG: DUF2717 domain-containing protein [Spirochaetia bacterium]|nr:DUF2717 domain-containing protein [Spirochaetia bacterium]